MNFNISTRPHISRGVSDIFTRPGPLGMNLGVTGMGHEDAFPRRRPNGRCRIQKRSVASLAPRLVPLPVRMPLPPAEHQGSIYENQRASGRRYFATPDEAPRIAAE
jgi:hypothetical protein